MYMYIFLFGPGSRPSKLKISAEERGRDGEDETTRRRRDDATTRRHREADGQRAGEPCVVVLSTRIFKHSPDHDRGGDARKAARTRSAAAAPSWSDVARAAKHCVPHRESSSPSHHHRKKRRKHATYLCVCVCVDFAFFCAERLLLILMADQHDTITHAHTHNLAPGPIF